MTTFDDSRDPRPAPNASRWSGFYKRPVEERRDAVESRFDLHGGAVAHALADGGLPVSVADKTIENVLGTYALPFAVGLHVMVNGRERIAPMVVEEPSVVAAASNAAKMVRAGGGFRAEADAPLMIAQVALHRVPDAALATKQISEARKALLRLADEAVPGLVLRGGGARDLEVRDLGDGMLAVHVVVDCRDAMGANLVNTVAEHVAPRIAALSGGEVGLRILSNLADRRLVRVSCHVPVDALAFEGFPGAAVRDGIVLASRFAERDPYRAATHNKGIMNGVDAVVMATGNDWRAVEAGAHAYAARSGAYAPLAVWRRERDGEGLVGELTLPLALGIVGGPTRVHRGAQFALKLAEVTSAQDLACLVAAVGLASNLAALRALSTVGIQEGHMALHARSVAIAAGARGQEVEWVARQIHGRGTVTLEAATHALAKRRAETHGDPVAAE